MKKIALNSSLCLLTLAFSICVAGPVRAATAISSVTLNGTVNNPASCTIAAQSVDVTFSIPPEGAYFHNIERPISITCSSGTTYSIKAPAANNFLNLGTQTSGMTVKFINNGKNMFTYPVAGVGSGSTQSIQLQMQFMTAHGNPFGRTSIGAVSGAANLTVTY